MEHQYGSRVGVLLSANEYQVELIGYGVYEGPQPIPLEGPERPAGFVGMCARESVQFTPDKPHLNPRIRLDSGSIVWGCESWWASEEYVKKICASGREVIHVDINAVRAQLLAEEDEERAAAPMTTAH
jgi:hypothetical protein